jgi:hypothetical protein
MVLLYYSGDPITPMNIENFAPGTDSVDSDAEIENHERQLEQTLLQLKMAFRFSEDYILVY